MYRGKIGDGSDVRSQDRLADLDSHTWRLSDFGHCTPMLTRKRAVRMENRVEQKCTFVLIPRWTSPIDEEFALGDGYSIARIPDELMPAFDRYASLHAPDGSAHLVGHYDLLEMQDATHCVKHAYLTPPKARRFEAESQLRECAKRVVQAIQLIRPTEAAPKYILQTRGEQLEVETFVHTHQKSLVDDQCPLEPFKREELDTVQTFWKRICESYTHHETRFNRVANALECFRVGLDTRAYQIRITLFVIGLESLYSTRTAEITYLLAQRVAWFLGRDGSEREELFRLASEVYSLRSTIVHGSSQKYRVGAAEKRVAITFAAEDLLRRSLRKILTESGFRNVFLVSDNIEGYFGQLTLGVPGGLGRVH